MITAHNDKAVRLGSAKVMTIADVLDRAAMQAHAEVAVRKALERVAPQLVRRGVEIGALRVGEARGAEVTVRDDEAAT